MAIDAISAGEAMINPFMTIWASFVAILPGLLAAIILVFIGYYLGKLLGYIFQKILERLGLDKRMKKAGLSDAIGHLDLSHVGGLFIKWYIFIIFLGEAASVVNFGTVSFLLNKFLFWLPNLVVAFLIMVLGLVLADFLSHKMSKVKIKSIRALSSPVRVLIIFLVALVALNQAGFYVSIAENAFLIILAGFVLTMAIALGIGFGIAMKDEAKGIIKSFKKKV